MLACVRVCVIMSLAHRTAGRTVVIRHPDEGVEASVVCALVAGFVRPRLGSLDARDLCKNEMNEQMNDYYKLLLMRSGLCKCGNR